MAIQTLARAANDVWTRGNSLEASSIAAFAGSALSIDSDVADLAGATRCTRPQFSVQNHGAANRIADANVENISRIPSGAGFVLTISGSIRVIFQLESQAGRLH